MNAKQAPRRALLVLCLASLLASFGACDKPKENSPGSEKGPEAIQVSDSSTGLVYRYLSHDATRVKTAVLLGEIPEAARSQVVVLDPNHPPPAGWDYVMDLTQGLPQKVPATQGFSFVTRRTISPKEAPKPDDSATTKASAASGHVVLFSTQHCPHCTRARRFLDKHNVGFSEFDLERDGPRAQHTLQALAKAAGADRRKLRGVPIVFVGKNVVYGFDQGRLTQLLGL